jgi:anti-anti-sigma regulatory factor
MATTAYLQKNDGERLTEELNAALVRLDNGELNITLDFSSVQRLSPPALQLLEKLAASSEERSVKVVLHGLAVNVYKVLKLARLSGRFDFVS